MNTLRKPLKNFLAQALRPRFSRIHIRTGWAECLGRSVVEIRFNPRLTYIESMTKEKNVPQVIRELLEAVGIDKKTYDFGPVLYDSVSLQIWEPQNPRLLKLCSLA